MAQHGWTHLAPSGETETARGGGCGPTHPRAIRQPATLTPVLQLGELRAAPGLVGAEEERHTYESRVS